MQRKTPNTPAQIRIAVLSNADSANLHSFIKASVERGSTVYTDDWPGYRGLSLWYDHQVICHSSGLYAEDRDGDGYAEVHCNTAEGQWSLLRHSLRAHRGIHKGYLPYYTRTFEYFQNMDLTSCYDKVDLYLRHSLLANPMYG